MTTTWEDIAWDMAMEDQYFEDLYHENVEHFSKERLKSYYIDNPDLAECARKALITAQDLLPDYPIAAHVFAAIALEIGIKQVFLKPLVYGLVHSESLAELIANYAVGRGSPGHFKGLLLGLLREQANLDLESINRPGSDKSLWSEMAYATDIRNEIVHSWKEVTREEAEVAIISATMLLEEIFPTVLTELGLQLDENNRIQEKEDT